MLAEPEAEMGFTVTLLLDPPCIKPSLMHPVMTVFVLLLPVIPPM